MSLFLFGVMRGGSSIVTDIFFRIASAGGVSHDDPITTLYDKNINIHSPLVQEKSESSLTKKALLEYLENCQIGFGVVMYLVVKKF